MKRHIHVDMDMSKNVYEFDSISRDVVGVPIDIRCNTAFDAATIKFTYDETAGIKLPNGRIIYTDPTKKDTDGDGLTDFEETGIVYNVNDRYIGLGTYRTVKYFIMRSNPAVKDTDGDGIWDKEDTSPNFAD